MSSNPIPHSSVDSAAAIHIKLGPGEKQMCFYWICARKNRDEVRRLNETVWEKTPEAILRRTHDYWTLWADRERSQL